MPNETEIEVNHAKPVAVFPQTLWTVVLRAKDKSEPALNTLLGSYRQPLMVYLHCKGYNPQTSEDIVHDFFAQLLKNDFLKNVGREKGKFRTFLLISFDHFLNDRRDKENARKRGEGRQPESLNETDDEGRLVHEPVSPQPLANEEYDKAWASAILSHSLHSLELECARTGHASLCHALEPVFYGDAEAGSYREIGERLGMAEGAVKVAAHRMRVRLRGLIREAVLQTLDSESDLDSELSYLLGLFSRKAG